MNEEILFHLALEQPHEERAAFLEKMCVGNEPLRLRLASLLHASENPDNFLGESSADLQATLDAPPTQAILDEDTPQPLSEGPGSRIGLYKLLEQIGDGGMGTVFLAEQTEPVQRKVALKIIKPGMDSWQFIARFEAERQTLALMDHPHIAKVFNAGTTDSGRPYFVMELVPGVPITKYCDAHRLTPRERLELFLPVCRAVQHAHQKGIIHRDLKPSNVLVALSDGKPVPKVIDFGVAKAMRDRLTEKTLLTEFSTLEYLSPEQAELNQPDIDTRSDVYSLGVLLYELLTGTTPLERKRLQQTDVLEVMRLIREEESPRPSTRLTTMDELPTVAAKRGLEPKKLGVLMRGDLDWIVMKCLEKDRNRRYETVNTLAMDLECYLHDEPVSACPPSSLYRCRKFTQRHKAALLVSALVLLVMLSAGGGVGWMLWDRTPQQAQQAQQVAEQAPQETIQQTELAERVAETERAVNMALAKTEQLTDQAGKMPATTSQEANTVLGIWRQAEAALGQADAVLSTGGTEEHLRKRVREVREQIERGRQRDEERRAQALRKEKLLSDLDEARLARAALIDGHFDYDGAVTKYAQAFTAYGLEVKPGAMGDLAQRIRAEQPTIREALIVALDDWSDAAARVQTEGSPDELRAISTAADDDPWRKKYRQAVADKDGAALQALSAEARQMSLSPSSIRLLAISLYFQDQREEAVALLRWARGRHPTDFWIPVELGAFLFNTRGRSPVDLEEAIGCYRAALALRPGAGVVYNYLAVALFAKNEVDESLAACRKAIEINPRYAPAHYNLGVALSAKQDLGGAIAAYRTAIEINPKYAQAYSNLGQALLDKKELEQALAACRKAIELDPKLAQAHYTLGICLSTSQDLDGAIAAYQKAVEIDPKFALAYYNLGIALTRKPDRDGAISAFRKTVEIDPKFVNAYYNLGIELAAKKEWSEAIATYRKTIELDPKNAQAHNSLGVALAAKTELDEAIVSYRKAIENDSKLAVAHYNLGNALRAKNQLDEAIVAYRAAVEINPQYAHAYNNLGNALFAKKDVDEAIIAYRKAAEIDSKLMQAHFSLGTALLKKGQFAEAKTSTQKALELLPEQHPLRGRVLKQLEDCDRLPALEGRLADILAGKAKPKDNRERLSLAETCQLQRRYAAAFQLYRDAFTADPKLAADLQAAHRFNAARAAVLAVAGQGTDANKLDDKESTKIRKQALDWMRADLELWSKRLDGGKPEDRSATRETLQSWQRDPDLAGVRDSKALQKLPQQEEASWRKLWADVAQLVKKAGDAK